MSTEEDEKDRDYAAFLAQLPAPLYAPHACRHLTFGAFVAVQRLEDTGRFMAELRVLCLHCREPFRFIGLTPGLSYVEPSCAIDGTEALLPIEPEVEKRLFAGARYVVPPPPETRQ